MSNPQGARARQVIRYRLQTDAAERARNEALVLGSSPKCAGIARPYGVEPSGWHRDELGGCANDGSTCICECHDQPEVETEILDASVDVALSDYPGLTYVTVYSDGKDQREMAATAYQAWGAC